MCSKQVVCVCDVVFPRPQLGEDMTKKLEHVQFSVPEVDDIRAEHVCAEQMGMHLFELYLTLHEFCDLKEHLPAR